MAYIICRGARAARDAGHSDNAKSMLSEAQEVDPEAQHSDEYSSLARSLR